MNEKLNIQDLIDALAVKHGMNRKNADSFVKEFFQLIEESLEHDKYVKIKGLGTFKLIGVGSRESINVNTGERFEIQGHTKVSFTPEPTLKDIINRPFSHFETVVLNEGTVLDDTPVENDNEEEDVVLSVKEESMPEEVKDEQNETFADTPETVAEMADDDMTDTDRTVAATTETESEPVKNEAEETVCESVVVPETEPEAASESSQQEAVVKKTSDSSTMKYFIGIVVFIVLLCGSAVVFMYYPNWLDSPVAESSEKEILTGQVVDKPVIPQEENEALADSMVVQNDVVARDSVKGSIKADSVAKVTVQTPKVVAQAKKAAPFEPDSLRYTIEGTETTYTIKEGETLTRVALRFYGTKALWPYIVKHNPKVIKNPDNVPYGTTIKIPKLVKKQ